jgi:ParG.
VSEDKYQSQRKYLEKQKRLQVWISPEKYDAFKAAVQQEGKSIYSVIHEFIDSYLSKNAPPPSE